MTWKNKKILVAGGCGFLGSYVVEELVSGGARVSVADNLETGLVENLAAVQGEIDFICEDLLDPSVCGRVTRGMDAVMNLAGCAAGIEYSMNHHAAMLYQNTMLQMNLLEASRLNGVGRFLFVSSSCVYPDEIGNQVFESQGMAGQPSAAHEGYGWSKRIGELQARYYHAQHGMPIAVCRPFNLYGARDRWQGEKSHVIPALVKKVLEGEDPLVVWGSGRQRRNFLHARDVARMMLLVTERFATAEPVNIAAEEDISIAELVYLICEIAGRRPKIIFDNSKPEGSLQRTADRSLFQRIVPDFEPEINLGEGIREMIDEFAARVANLDGKALEIQ